MLVVNTRSACGNVVRIAAVINSFFRVYIPFYGYAVRLYFYLLFRIGKIIVYRIKARKSNFKLVLAGVYKSIARSVKLIRTVN